jgi:glycosyltransferase involved in cell wall biosynthesis
MRTLVITAGVPYPPIGGVALRNWQNIQILMNFGTVAVFCIPNISDDLQYEQPLPETVVWHHNSLRNTNFWQYLEQKLIWKLHPQQHYLVDFRYLNSTDQKLKQVLREFQPDLVVFADCWLYRYLPTVQQYGCPIILDEHNVEARLFVETLPPAHGLRASLQTLIAAQDFKTLKRIEGDFVEQADQVWMCSDTDAKLLKTVYGEAAKVRVVPNGLDVTYYDQVRLGECQLPSELAQVSRSVILSADFAYPPNQVAAQLLIEQIFPRLRTDYPDCQLILAGKMPTAPMREAAQNDPQTVVTGRVTDMRPYLASASVVIVPLFQGGGTRLKILEAFAAGRPVVSTSKGAEGLKAEDRQHLLLRDSVEALVEGVSEIWTNRTLRQRLVQNAYALVKAEYSWTAIGKSVEQYITELTQN